MVVGSGTEVELVVEFEEMVEGIGVEIELVELVLTVVEWEEAGEGMVR